MSGNVCVYAESCVLGRGGWVCSVAMGSRTVLGRPGSAACWKGWTPLLSKELLADCKLK